MLPLRATQGKVEMISLLHLRKSTTLILTH